MSESKEYFLTSRHGNCGSSVMFHNKDEHGYGTDVTKLEKYTREEAQKAHDQYGRGSLPLLSYKVLELMTWRVDHQYVDIAKGLPINKPASECVVSYPREINGNDICFIKKGGGLTFNLDDAEVYLLGEMKDMGYSSVIWSLQYLKTKCRATFQENNINTRSMCRGVKLQRIKKSSDSGKTRWNCPSCGKISWQYNPYDFEGCKDWNCSEHNSYMSSY